MNVDYLFMLLFGYFYSSFLLEWGDLFDQIHLLIIELHIVCNYATLRNRLHYCICIFLIFLVF